MKNRNVDISRFEIYLARQALNIYSNYKEQIDGQEKIRKYN